ncbi:MAG: hypothetical protein AAGE37_00665 [Pseudomonadota bacterium]
MDTIKTNLRALVRIALGYVVACFAAALGIFLIGSLLTIGQPLMEGVTWQEDIANQFGYLPVFAAMAGILAAPVAAIMILVS